MPVVIANKARYAGIAAVSQLNQETTVVELGPFSDDWMVEGYIDMSGLQSGDTVVVSEYVALDGANYRLLYSATVGGPAPQPAVRFHTKTLLSTMKYKVTVKQTGGTPRSVPYYFVVEVMGSA
ncbi:MAG: hypothetical protein LM580_10320 [Thermofilum sp.]|nr:hypothetical protein [Thermofilum sp.]